MICDRLDRGPNDILSTGPRVRRDATACSVCEWRLSPDARQPSKNRWHQRLKKLKYRRTLYLGIQTMSTSCSFRITAAFSPGFSASQSLAMHRCQPSRNRAGNPAFWLISRIPAFLRKRPAFLAFFRNNKNR